MCRLLQQHAGGTDYAGHLAANHDLFRDNDAGNGSVLAHDQLHAVDIATQMAIDLNIALAPKIAAEPHRAIEHGPGAQLGVVQVGAGSRTVQWAASMAVVARIETHVKPRVHISKECASKCHLPGGRSPFSPLWSAPLVEGEQPPKASQ